MENDFLKEKGIGILVISVSLMHTKSSSGIVQNCIFGLLGTFLFLLFFPLHWILLLTV